MKQEKKTVQLSERLKKLTEMVTPGYSVADVGCDHGFVSIYLVQEKISPKVLAMDVRTGPLSAAKEHIAEWGMEEYIETRLSDGLEKMVPGEVQSLICAGMGGPLMQKILTDWPEKTDSFCELILQPQSELAEFRRFLREHGFCIVEEAVLYEEGKYYFPMKAVKQNTNACKFDDISEETLCLYDTYGELLIKEKNSMLIQYLEKRKQILTDLIASLETEHAERTKMRLAQLQEELTGVKTVLAMM